VDRKRIILVGGATTLVATLAAFCLGAIAVGTFCEKVLVPIWVKQYPHDGQIGLAVFVYAFYGGVAAGLAALVVGIIWTSAKAGRFSPGADTDSPTQLH
jgi:hypothetical protein